MVERLFPNSLFGSFMIIESTESLRLQIQFPMYGVVYGTEEKMTIAVQAG